ncbi:MAG: AAA family ATPase [Chloroflexi bacterium]|nr:AAA family ATPase [Chloroflexota bacterium]
MNLSVNAFVGREQEFAALSAALDDALSGQGRLVMLAGEPGIGKTRIAQELAAIAKARGFQALWGHCYEGEGAPPYWPWVQVIRSYADDSDAETLRLEMGSGAAAIAQIVPRVAERLPDMKPLPALDPEQARFRLFDSIAAFLNSAAKRHPLTLVLEDLHWADRPSLLLLEFIAREMANSRILLIGTHRDVGLSRQHPLSETLGGLGREKLFQRSVLRGLAHDDVGSLMQATLGKEPPPALVDAVYAQTGGNPFFVSEVARLLAQEGTPGAAAIRVPEGVREAIGRRLSRLSQGCDRTLTVASVIGREFELEQLERLVEDMSGEQLLEVMEEALAARVIEELPQSAGRYQFSHALMQQTIASGLSAARRARLHGQIAEALEDLYGARANDHADELAYHFLRGNVLQKAADYSLKAGDRAYAVYAWEQAIAFYETAMELLERLEAEPRQRAELLEKLARAAAMSGGSKTKDFPAYSERALSLYEALGDHKKTGSVHLQAARLLVFGDWETAHSHALKAVALLEPEGESSQLAGAYVHTGHTAAHLSGPISGAIALMEKGLALAERLGSVAEATNATNYLAHALVYHAGELKRGIELHHKCWEVAREKDAPVAAVSVAFLLSTAYVLLRDVDGSILWAERGIEAADEARIISRKIQAYLHIGQASILRGEVRRALMGLEMAQETARKIGVEVSHLAHPSILAPALVCFYLGDWEKAEAELLKCLESAKQTHTVAVTHTASCALGELYMEAGDFAGAKRYLMEAATVSEARGEKPLEIAPRTLLVQIAARSSELDDAAVHLRRAQEIVSNGEDWRGLAAEIHMAEGVLATAEERWQDAEAAFQKATEINRQYHLPYYEAKCLMEWGQMRLSRNDRGDRQQGMALLDQALGIFQDIQASKMVEKAIALKEHLEAQPTKAPQYPDGLTGREVEVLRLIAAGRTNQEIGNALFITLNTVARHVSNIFAKTGAANRVEAATYAGRHGLIS